MTLSHFFARLAPAFAPRGVTLCALSYRSTTQPSEAAVVMMMTYSYHCTLAPRRSHIAWRPLVLSANAQLSAFRRSCSRDAVVFLCTFAARVHTAWRQLVLSAIARLSLRKLQL